MRIIVVDDDLIMLHAIKARLQKEDYHVFTTNDAQDALDTLEEEEESYDLIISDIMMPYISGIELLSAIRKIKGNVPIIIISALEQKEVVLTAFELGAHDFLNKPFDMDNLMEKVKQFESVKTSNK